MRNEHSLTIDDRGKSLLFKIREMPAFQLESWLCRLVLLLQDDLDDDATINEVINRAFTLIRDRKMKAFRGVEFEKLQPLMDELLACCHRVSNGPHGGLEQQVRPETACGYIEDVRTIIRLRLEALRLNLGFFFNAEPSDSPPSPEEAE